MDPFPLLLKLLRPYLLAVVSWAHLYSQSSNDLKTICNLSPLFLLRCLKSPSRKGTSHCHPVARQDVPLVDKCLILIQDNHCQGQQVRHIQTHSGGFIFYMKAYFTVLISKWNNFKLLMLSTLLVIINHRAISEGRNQEASVVTRSPFLGWFLRRLENCAPSFGCQ